MFKHCIPSIIFLMIFPRLSILRNIPKDEGPDPNEAYNFADFDEIYDQKQNGSYNVRVTIDGVNVLWQPSSDISYDIMGAVLESAVIGAAGILPWPSSSESTDTLEDFFNSTTTKYDQDGTNLTTEAAKPEPV